MQSQHDPLDSIIKESNINFNIDEDYNQKLLLKLNEKRQKFEDCRTLAISLVTAGFILLSVNIKDIQYNIGYLKYKIKTEVAFIEDININKFITLNGEWFK